MAETVKYLSAEWGAEVEKRLSAELTPERMNKITSSMSNRYLNCPDGAEHYFTVRYENGAVSEVAVGTGDPPDAEFRITGDYETFAKISRAEMKAQVALMTGKLKLKGNMIKALKLASVVDRMNKVISTIPTEY